MVWVAIDFETANESRASACALGIAVVDQGQIVERRSWLIRPLDLYFNPYNVEIHGIQEEDVVGEPTFDKLWKNVRPLLDGRTLVAHNARFDVSVLRSSLNEYGITFPEVHYYCTRVFAKKAWPSLLSYSLDTIARQLGIDFHHHDPKEDAAACAEIVLRCCNQVGAKGIEDAAKELGVIRVQEYISVPTPEGPTGDTVDTEHPFYGKTFVFTGTLQSMSRADAVDLVMRHGGRSTSAVSKKTDFLVLGDLDFMRFSEGKKGKKLREAESLLEEGSAIELLSEYDFLRMLDA